MSRPLTVASIIFLSSLAVLSTPALAQQTQTIVWDLGVLEPGKVYPTTISAQNASCPGAHTVVATLHDATWLRITGPDRFENLRPGEAETSGVEVDTRSLAPGYYHGWIRLRCTDCPPPPKCLQDISLVEVVLRIPATEATAPPTPPAPAPEELCSFSDVEGRFAPTQVVWQDDPDFADQATKQLRQLTPSLLEAELDMVEDRHALLFGTIRPVGGSPEAKRHEIFLRGQAQGSTPVDVKVRFYLSNGGPRRLLWESGDVGRVPLGPPCKAGTGTPFEVTQSARTGLPPERAFQFANSGGYTLTAELVTAAGNPTGIRAQVIGEVVATTPPKVLFLPLMLSGEAFGDEAARRALAAAARSLKDDSKVAIPDWFPITNTALEARSSQTLMPQVTDADRRAAQRFKQKFPDEDAGGVLRHILSEAIARQLQTGATFSSYDRIVAVLGNTDFDKFRTGPAARAGAFTKNGKVSFIDKDVSAFTFTVAHELTHTLPFAWTTAEIQRECRRGYHNNDREMVAHGFEIYQLGREDRRAVDGVRPIMGRSHDDRHAITQCTYWHLLKQLVKGPPDPPVILVQGYVARGAGGPQGMLSPAYQRDGVVDLSAGKGGDWAIQLRSARGKKLGRYPFVPVFEQPHGDDRPVTSFVARVPDSPDVGQIDLMGPEGLLDSLTYSDHAPTVELAPLERDDDRLLVSWAGTDADGDELLYTLLHSSDGGASWAPLAFEQGATTFEIVISEEDDDEHAVLVIATDGARSAEARVDLAGG